MKIKKNYIHNNKRQIFRLIPTDTEKIIIEERDIEKKQAYFNCLQIDSGKSIFKSMQLEEKFWLGIESVHKDIIYFHKYAKPDLPQHSGIIAFDINQQKTTWEDNNRNFLFIKDDVVFAYQQGFEGRKFSTLNRLTGKIIDELESDSDSINLLREEVIAAQDFGNYHFPVMYDPSAKTEPGVTEYFNKFREGVLISGKIEYVHFNNLLLFNYHQIINGEGLKNIFNAVDLSDRNCIFKETLNSMTNAFAPDSFFVRNNLLFLLIERSKLGVYRIIE
jgi:hypothetical protein